MNEARWVLGVLGCALVVGTGCSADSGNSGGPRGGTALTSGGAGLGIGTPGGIAANTGSASGVSGSNAFGNSTVPTMQIGDPNAAAAKCREPTVIFVIDGSGSMCAPFGNATRWTALRTALIDKTQGLIYKLQNRGDFGAVIYDGTIDFMAASMATALSPDPMCAAGAAFRRTMGMCPQMVEIGAARNNAGKIDTMYPAMELGGSTPTDKVMNHVVDTLIAAQVPPYDPTLRPQYIILATDGNPNDICMGGKGGDGTVQQMASVAAVDRAAAAGITTFVISMAGGDMALETHLTNLAMHGDPTNPGAHTYSPMNSADLVMALTQLLGAAFGCYIG